MHIYVTGTGKFEKYIACNITMVVEYVFKVGCHIVGDQAIQLQLDLGVLLKHADIKRRGSFQRIVRDNQIDDLVHSRDSLSVQERHFDIAIALKLSF